jgi:hypothetical protein
MRIATIGLVVVTAALVTACGPGPGSTEWCKGVIQGTIQASQAEIEANGQKCQEVLMKEVMGALGGTSQ